MTDTWYDFTEEPVYATSPSGFTKAAAFARATVTDITGVALPIRQNGIDVAYAEADASGYLHYQSTQPIVLRHIGNRVARRNSLQLEAASGDSADAIAQLDALAPVVGATRIVNEANLPDLSDTYAPLRVAGHLTVRQGDLTVNVKDYGATGDGATLDHAAIQNALDDVDAAGGGHLLIPCGTYVLGATLLIGANTRITGHGATLTPDASGLPIFYNKPGLNAAPGYTGAGNIVLDGVTCDMRGNVNLVPHNCMTFAHATDVTVVNVTIRNVSTYHAIEPHSVKAMRILNCRFEGWQDNTADHSSAFREAIQVDMVNMAGDDNTPVKDLLVQGCYFGPSDVCGPYGRAVGGHTIGTVPHEGIRVVDNYIDATGEEGIRAYCWANSVIAGNVVNNAGFSGIQAVATGGVNPARLAIIGNVVNGAGRSGIEVNSLDTGTSRYSHVTVVGNTVSGAAGEPPFAGIDVNYAHNALISGNRVNSGGGHGITTSNGDGCQVTGNFVTSPATAGIFIRGGASSNTGALVEANQVISSGTYGIQISNVGEKITDVTVIGNQIRLPGGPAGIRLSNGAQRSFIANNRVIVASATVTAAVSVYAGTSGGDLPASGAIVGNYLAGQGWAVNTAAQASSAWLITSGGNQTWPGAVITYGGPLVAWSATTGLNSQGSNMVTAP